MKKKVVLLSAGLLSMSLLLTGCFQKTNTSSNKDTTSSSVAEKNKVYLSSKIKSTNPKNLSTYSVKDLVQYFYNMGSREIGNKSNAVAGTVIADYWKESNIDPYDGKTYYYKFTPKVKMRYDLPGGRKFTFSGEAENIVGKIKGKDSTKAVVLSAHFDTWPGVKGVLDNTSGTAGMMYLANRLKEFYGSEQPPIDIVFAAFNGEEYMLAGSSAFYETLNKDYPNFYNVNLDCIGKKGKALAYNSDNKLSQSLLETVKTYLEAQKVKLSDLNYDDQGTSDHASFLENGKAAIVIGNDLGSKYVHTEKDNELNLDYDEIQKIITGLQNFIVESNGKMY
ncbi:M28 family metallopeptidase [uncultured Streptococcus sp.]|uniref:M28 family metallopeptidase n=1 Tax=uncultured Streptococcus sp. TaxID=83427 RepID=UPI0015B910F9|nr:M28 family peptidase [uncultured Streptococcus sp.]